MDGYVCIKQFSPVHTFTCGANARARHQNSMLWTKKKTPNEWFRCLCLCLHGVLNPFHFFLLFCYHLSLSEWKRPSYCQIQLQKRFILLAYTQKRFGTADVCWFGYDKNMNASTLLTHKHTVCATQHTNTHTEGEKEACAHKHTHALDCLYISCAFSIVYKHTKKCGKSKGKTTNSTVLNWVIHSFVEATHIHKQWKQTDHIFREIDGKRILSNNILFFCNFNRFFSEYFVENLKWNWCMYALCSEKQFLVKSALKT